MTCKKTGQYPTRWAAKKALERIKASHPRYRLTGWYWCPWHRAYELTSQERR